MSALEELLNCTDLPRRQAKELYAEVIESANVEAQRLLCQHDLFYLLNVGCKRRDMDHDWVYARCREVEQEPDGFIDLWSREHFKSSILTFGLSVQDILRDPETTIGILSHTRPIAKGFLEQIKREFEQNVYLKSLFPDILYKEPHKESPRWSLDHGIIVKRQSNPKEATVEAWGLVDGQPTGKHFRTLVYDDVVTRESVTTPDQIHKTTAAFELSLNLGSEGGRRRIIGTPYHMHDTYKEIMDRGSAVPRIYPATDTGEMDGTPVIWTRARLEEKRRDMGPYTAACQLFMNPVADKAMSFKPEWLKYYDQLGDTRKWNKYVLCDPANEKKKTSDYTVMLVIGLAPDNNFYLISGFRDRLNLTQRAQRLFELHRDHEPIKVGYEQYGMQADVQHVQYEMEQRNYRFTITPLGGRTPKPDRIKQLIPIFEQGRLWLPKRMPFIDSEGVTRDFIEIFLRNEYFAFPVCVHDDMLDCFARVLDPVLGAEFPKVEKPKPKQVTYAGAARSWMS